MKLFNLVYNRPSSFREQARKFRMDLNLDLEDEHKALFDFDSLCQAFAPSRFDQIFRGVSAQASVDGHRDDIQVLLDDFKPITVECEDLADVGFASLLLRDSESAFVSQLDFVNRICKSEFGKDVFLQDVRSSSEGHVIEISKLQSWKGRHQSCGFASRLSWIDFMDGGELLFVPCACLNIDLVWMTLKFC